MAAPSDHPEIRSRALEKLVVVAIIVFLAAITAVMMSRLEKQKQFAKNRARDDCEAWAIAAERFKAVTPPFMEAKSLYDPWGHEYMYQFFWSGSKPDVYSWGPRPYDPNSIIGNWK